MNVLKEAITCCDCKKILETPVFVPCGKSVCIRHLKNLPDNRYDCKSCGQQHKANRENMFVNTALENLIKANLDKFDFGEEYLKAFDYCKQLRHLTDQLDELRKDPAYFIDDTIAKLKNQAEILREEWKLTIDAETNQLIGELNEYERICKCNLETNEFVTKLKTIENELISDKQTLREWENMLNNFYRVEEQNTTISKNCKQRFVYLKNRMLTLKQELLMKNLDKYYEYLKDFPKIAKTGKDLFSFSSIQDLVYYCENYRPLDESKIVDTPVLQKELFNLCEFDYDAKLTLVYRASDHGFSSEEFHRRCDDLPNTLTIINSTEGNIFGGFSDVTWDSFSGYKESKNAFIFSLVNKKQQPFRVNIHPNETNYAIYCSKYFGPIFGGRWTTDHDDIHISNNSNTQSGSYSNFSSSYKNLNYEFGSSEAQSILAGSFSFKVKDIEVFKLIKHNLN